VRGENEEVSGTHYYNVAQAITGALIFIVGMLFFLGFFFPYYTLGPAGGLAGLLGGQTYYYNSTNATTNYLLGFSCLIAGLAIIGTSKRTIHVATPGS
jgi:hypothetical protein